MREINQGNLGFFQQEVEKLDAWADDLKLGLEQEIKVIDVEIKEIRRTAATSPTLEEKLTHQKHRRELESKRSKLRRELFARQDEVETQRNDLIAQLEKQLQQQVEERVLFKIQWELKYCMWLCLDLFWRVVMRARRKALPTLERGFAMISI